MTWVKLDDGFFRNRKARLAGKDGRALFIAGLCHCAGALTDGHIGDYDLALIAAEAEVKPKPASEALEKAGLWIRVTDGWIVNDYRQYNRSAAEVRAEREEGRKRAAESARKRKRSSGEASGEEHAKQERRNGAASPDPSSSSSRPLGSSSVSESSSSNLSPNDDDDWPFIIAKRRLAKRQADLGNVGNRRKWLVTTADDVISEHLQAAQTYFLEHPDATQTEIADHVEPDEESFLSRLDRLAAEMPE